MKRRRMHMYKRPNSENYWFKIRVPAIVRTALDGKAILIYSDRGNGYDKCLSVTPRVGEFLNFSLQTADDYVAGARGRDAQAHIEKLFNLYAAEPVAADAYDLAGLSGVAYRLVVSANFREPGLPERVALFKALNRAAAEGRTGDVMPLNPGAIDADAQMARTLFPGQSLTDAVNALEAGKHDDVVEQRFGLLADWVLIDNEVRLTTENRRTFLRHVARAMILAGWQLKRNSEFDYSADPAAKQFPSIDTVRVIRPKATFSEIATGWAKEAKSAGLSERTILSYPQSVERMRRHLGHDDASSVTEADIIAYKEERLAKVSAKTWTDADLPAIKSMFEWAAKNRKIASNPATNLGGIRVKRKRVRQPGFTDEEATLLLSAALAYQPGERETAKVTAAKRWAPWLAAYTGARIGEMLQLRKEDVFEQSGRVVIKITPEAGTVKSGNFRTVPLHPHLLEMGFLRFVGQSSDGHLFAEATIAGVYSRVTQFVRTIITDPNVQPNHAWRHRFKAVARKRRFEMRVVDAIQDHAPRTAGEDYGGEIDVETMAFVIDAIPRFQTTTPTSPVLSAVAPAQVDA